MCGAVSFVATDVPAECGICHCEMCRRWAGSALVDVDVPVANIIWHGTENIARLQSSSWAERAWCVKCGSGLYFRNTVASKSAEKYSVPIGLFDDPNGFDVTYEIYIDHKPDSYSFAGEGRKVLTRQQCVEKFPLLDSE